MRSPRAPRVPALRDDVRAYRSGERVLLEDAARLVRVPIDELGLDVVQRLASGAARPGVLATAVGAPRAEVRERVALLNRHLLLDTPRARDQIDVCRRARIEELWPARSLAQAPLHLAEDLGHACVATGSCCTATDIGPLRDEDVARLEAHDWARLAGSGAPGARSGWLVATQGPDGEPIRLLERRADRCVFLDADLLCAVHREAGVASKPTICRQFPHTFTRTPAGVDASLATECRGWIEARRAAGPVGAREGELRALLADGAPVMDLPLPVPVWDGLDWGLATWLEVRGQTLEGVRAAADLPSLVEALTGPVRAALATSMAPYEESELFVRRAAWGIPEVDSRGGGHVTEFLDTCARLRERLDGGLRDLAGRYRAAGEAAQAERHERLAWALRSLLGGERLDDITSGPGELEIWRDMAVAALWAHEPARRHHVLGGMAQLVGRVLIGRQLSRLLARTSLRARASGQDAVDTMVLLTKMLRGTAVATLLRGSQRELVTVLLFGGAVFARGAAPPAIGDEPSSRLPGAA